MTDSPFRWDCRFTRNQPSVRELKVYAPLPESGGGLRCLDAPAEEQTGSAARKESEQREERSREITAKDRRAFAHTGNQSELEAAFIRSPALTSASDEP